MSTIILNLAEHSGLPFSRHEPDPEYIDSEPGGFFFEHAVQIGRDADKTPANHHATVHWDTREINPNSKVIAAKLTFNAAETDSGDFDWKIKGRKDTDYIHEVRPHTTSVTARIATIIADYGSVQISDQSVSPIVQDSVCFIYYYTPTFQSALGVTSVSQAFSVNADASLGAITINMLRSHSSVTGNMWIKLYKVKEDRNGRKIKGRPLATSVVKDIASALPTISVQTNVAFVGLPWTFDNGNTANAFPVKDGQEFIAELQVEFTGGGLARWLTVGTTSNQDGSTYNLAQYGEGIGGGIGSFDGNAVYISGAEAYTQSMNIATEITVPNPLLAWTADTVYTYGEDWSGGTDVTLTGFTAFIQELLDNRQHGKFIAIQFWGGGAVDDRQRAWHSSRAATETAFGLKGAVLSIEFEQAGPRQNRRRQRRRKC